MNKQILIKCEDGSEWLLPVETVAENRARYFAGIEYNGDVEESLRDDTLPLFEQDDYEIIDWAKNNMEVWDWDISDVVRIKEPKGDDLWDGEWEIIPK